MSILKPEGAEVKKYLSRSSLAMGIAFGVMTLSYFVLSRLFLSSPYFASHGFTWALLTPPGAAILFPIFAIAFVLFQIANSYYQYRTVREHISFGDWKAGKHMKVQITLLLVKVIAAIFLAIVSLYMPALILPALAACFLAQGLSDYSIRRKFAKLADVSRKVREDEVLPEKTLQQMERIDKYNNRSAWQIGIYIVAFVACLFALHPMLGLGEIFSALTINAIALSMIAACFAALIYAKSYDIYILPGSQEFDQEDEEARARLVHSGVDQTDQQGVAQPQLNRSSSRESLDSQDSHRGTGQTPPDRKSTGSPLHSGVSSFASISYATSSHTTSSPVESPSPQSQSSPVLSAATASSSISEASAPFQLLPQQQQLQPPPVFSAATASSSISEATSSDAVDFLSPEAEDDTVSNKPRDEEDHDTGYSND